MQKLYLRLSLILRLKSKVSYLSMFSFDICHMSLENTSLKPKRISSITDQHVDQHKFLDGFVSCRVSLSPRCYVTPGSHVGSRDRHEWVTSQGWLASIHSFTKKKYTLILCNHLSRMFLYSPCVGRMGSWIFEFYVVYADAVCIHTTILYTLQ